jgi:hypothetical protein
MNKIYIDIDSNLVTEYSHCIYYDALSTSTPGLTAYLNFNSMTFNHLLQMTFIV